MNEIVDPLHGIHVSYCLSYGLLLLFRRSHRLPYSPISQICTTRDNGRYTNSIALAVYSTSAEVVAETVKLATVPAHIYIPRRSLSERERPILTRLDGPFETNSSTNVNLFMYNSSTHPALLPFEVLTFEILRSWAS